MALLIATVLCLIYLVISTIALYKELAITRQYHKERGEDITSKQWAYIIKKQIPDCVGIAFALYAVYKDPLFLVMVSLIIFLIIHDIYRIFQGNGTGVVKLD